MSRWRVVILYALFCAWLSIDDTSHGQEASARTTVQIVVEPPVVDLHGTNRSQHMLVTAIAAKAEPRDVTRSTRYVSSNPAVARWEDGAVVGVAEGNAEIRVIVEGAEATVPVRVRNFAGYPPVDFGNDVLPLLSKRGCNNGGCHGKASGQNGFKLSVFGFDPVADFESLVMEGRGRRLSSPSPEASLFLGKATGTVPHGGGQRVSPGSADHELLLAWVRQGTPPEQPNAPKLERLVVSPIERVLSFASQQQILATAFYSDGSQRDVTAAAGYTSNSTLIAEVEGAGLVRMGQIPGEASITVHYMGQVASVQLQLPRAAGVAVDSALPAQNRIDELVAAKLQKMRLSASGLADDATFLRRLYLDTLGTLPTPGEVRLFLADQAVDKRVRWIDQVLERPEFADYWALIWSDILLVDRQKLGERGAFESHRWLREQFLRNRPYNEWVAELVTATGNSGTNGPVNFFRALETPEEQARAVSQAFLGVRMECAQCHHHPFEKWSQDDFFGMVGYFNGLERKVVAKDRVLVFHAGLRETRVPISAKIVPTRPLDGPILPLGTEGDPRQSLARWLVAPENPWFSRLIANRLWKHFLGRGIVEPEDDLRSTNPPTNEPLLTFLAEQTVASKFDLKAMMRLILNSRTYQLSSETNETNHDDEQNFSHHAVKRLPAEVLLDAICQSAGEAEAFPGRPPRTRAIELWDNRLPSYFLEIFGRPERTTPCECGRSSEPTMSQALHLMNAPEVEAKVSSHTGRVAQLIDTGASESQIIEELCLAALGRLPREAELAIAKKLFADAPPRQAAEDFLWTLLNSYDFLFIK